MVLFVGYGLTGGSGGLVQRQGERLADYADAVVLRDVRPRVEAHRLLAEIPLDADEAVVFFHGSYALFRPSTPRASLSDRRFLRMS